MSNATITRTQDSSQALRSDIADTRRRMDATIDRISERLEPRHLIDEIIHWARSSPDATERARKVTKVMARNVIEWVEENPVPTILLGGAIASYLYGSWSHRVHPDESGESGYSEGPYAGYQVSSIGYEAMSDSDAGDWSDEGGVLKRTASSMKERARKGMRAARERAEAVGHMAKDKLHQAKDRLAHARERAGSAGSRLRERSAEKMEHVRHEAEVAWTHGRDRLGCAIDDRPLTAGLGFLALGVLAGLVLPATGIERRSFGPTARRVRRQSRELAEEAFRRGREAVNAATEAGAREAEAQGLTPHQVAEKAKIVAQTAAEAGSEVLHTNEKAESPATGSLA